MGELEEVGQMNWLSHAVLSPPDTLSRMGSVLADFVTDEQARGVGEAFYRGVRCHRAMDAFTDSHALWKRSRLRLPATQRRFAGIVVDVLYDHFLARHWDSFQEEPLKVFTSRFYREAQDSGVELPGRAGEIMGRIASEDLLASYRTRAGIGSALTRLLARVSERVRRPVDIRALLDSFHADYAGYEADFLAFFPEAQAFFAEHVARRRA